MDCDVRFIVADFFLSACTFWFNNMITLPFWLIHTNFGTCLYHCLLLLLLLLLLVLLLLLLLIYCHNYYFIFVSNSVKRTNVIKFHFLAIFVIIYFRYIFIQYVAMLSYISQPNLKCLAPAVYKPSASKPTPKEMFLRLCYMIFWTKYL
jgi:hypothetical protein